MKQGENIERVLKVDNNRVAPIGKEQKIGTLDFVIDDEVVYTKELYSPEKVYEKNYPKFLKENLQDYLHIINKDIRIML